MNDNIVKFSFNAPSDKYSGELVKVPEEKRKVIHDIIKNWYENLSKDTSIKLFELTAISELSTLEQSIRMYSGEYIEFSFESTDK